MFIKLFLAGLIVMATGSTAGARPVRHTPLDLVEKAPVLVLAKVTGRGDGAASAEIIEVFRGPARGPVLRLPDLPQIVPISAGLALQPGDTVILGLTPDGAFFSADDSRLHFTTDARSLDVVSSLLARVDDDPANDDDAQQRLVEALSVSEVLPPSTRLLTIEALQRGRFHAPEQIVDEALRDALEAPSADLRWRALVAARELDRVDALLGHFVEGIEDADRSIRAASIEGLRTLRVEAHGYDPAITPVEQAGAIADWKAWAERRVASKTSS